MRAQQEKFVIPAGRVNFEIELRPGVRQIFPRHAKLACLFGQADFGRAPEDDGRRLQVGRGAQDTFFQFVSGNYSESNRFAALFGHGKSFGKQKLFDAAEELVGFEFNLAGTRTAHQLYMQHNNIAPLGFDAVEDGPEMIKRMIIAYRNENIARPRPHTFSGQLGA